MGLGRVQYSLYHLAVLFAAEIKSSARGKWRVIFSLCIIYKSTETERYTVEKKTRGTFVKRKTLTFCGSNVVRIRISNLEPALHAQNVFKTPSSFG